MKEKGNESSSSSLVIVSRRMLITGIAGTAIFSFGLGYFFGYGGTTTSRMANHIEADNRITTSEERTVLDSSGNSTIVPPSVMQGSNPKEAPLITRRDNEVASAPKINQELPKSSAEKKPEGIQLPEKKATNAVEKNGSVEKKTDTHEAALKGKDIGDGKVSKKGSVAKARKKQSKPTAKNPSHRPASFKNRYVYAVQVGAFSDPSKARRLKNQLSAKGYKAYIIAFSPASGKTLSRVKMGHYTTKKEAEELASGLKNEGIESVVVYGGR
ncbi:MAG: SPOR domain-containing protein [Dissulfurispiraceae bacterium]